MYSIRLLLLLCWYKYSNIYDPPARCCSRARLKRRGGGAPPRIWASGQVILHQQRAEAGRDDANTTRMQCIIAYLVVFDVYSSDVRAPCKYSVLRCIQGVFGTRHVYSAVGTCGDLWALVNTMYWAYWMCILCRSGERAPIHHKYT